MEQDPSSWGLADKHGQVFKLGLVRIEGECLHLACTHTHTHTKVEHFFEGKGVEPIVFWH